jgi:hypothetical protein
MYKIFFPGKNRKDSLQKDVIVIASGKGLGKTTPAKYIAKLYKKYNKYDRIILLTGITNVKFPSYVKVINLNNIMPVQENLDTSLFNNSLVIFADWKNHPIPEVQSFLDRQ